MDVTNTSTEEELVSLDSTNQGTQVSSEILTENTDDKCSKCHSSDIDKRYIIGHDVTHCICNTCYQEWIE